MSEAKKDSPLQIMAGFAMLAGIFLMGRCSAAGEGEFGPIIPPTPSETPYNLGPPHNQMFEPPQQFYGDARVIVSFMLPESVPVICESDRANACFARNIGKPELILPNPCRWMGIESYASIACHELAHANGWKHPEKGDPDYPTLPDWSCRPPKLCKAGKP